MNLQINQVLYVYNIEYYRRIFDQKITLVKRYKSAQAAKQNPKAMIRASSPPNMCLAPPLSKACTASTRPLKKSEIKKS